ncbi:MAG: terminase [Gammaproteobacteria bacterium]|nr:terminase [Gammaproteobacteria bacterium]
MSATSQDLEKILLDEIVECYEDFYRFVMFAFAWGEPGSELAEYDGPDKWQLKVMASVKHHLESDPMAIYRDATASGHGIGKSTMCAWIMLWLMSTRPHLNGIITANTWTQLKTKTWRELAIWHKRLINRHWFKWTETRFFHVDHPETWYCSPIPNSEHNSEAFAGQHGRHTLIIYDEASAIPDKIWEVSGGVNDPRVFWFVFGNPTQNSGRFKQCFGRFRNRWITRHVDSRDCKMPNQKELQADVDEWGEDSDYVRVRIRGVFPRMGEEQFISAEIVEQAQARIVDVPWGTPKILGVDVARYGNDMTVFVGRHGRKLSKIQKFRDLNTMEVADRIIQEKQKSGVDVVMIDGIGLGAGVVDRCRQLGHDVVEVISGGKPDLENEDVVYNKRAEMWYRGRDWLETADIPDDPDLENDLIEIKAFYDMKHRIQMEKKQDMKKRGLASPDVGDALMLTFAYKTPPIRRLGSRAQAMDPEPVPDF